ncbi:hypothetical protein WJ0W_007135 [Paenibacillus melissococcoides]|uniref:Uncharacterized protein n=1 Tax=Paenibacillus melissococcoides TaxID=2912268 RepID=A0ABM9GB76_9BACL|nr:TcpD family membrane protein [Paenibacillus melissococcoides]CAH8248467.1 hypothetical protein WJ0W_007135 [Paenibacillus melissococcoides]CAH8722122.1 hypothetical protein HTL2_006705 [Paenibacillus melissococcoides]CAH8722141.1 hypothetical protein WDD9_006644 [Paenibacillus melissococcoides]
MNSELIAADYPITGIALVDAIFTLVVRGLLALFIIILIVKCVKLFGQGNYPQLFINLAIGLVLLALMLGPETLKNIGNEVLKILPNSSGGKGTGGGSGV